jgi:DNA-binding CsgD family transcriptional regulator
VTDDPVLHRTIGDIYDAALSPDGAAVLSSSLLDCVSASSGSLTLVQPSSGRVLRVIGRSENIDDASVARYDENFYNRNPWAIRLAHREPPLAVRGSELIPEASLLRTEFYTDWCRPMGICHLIGTLHVARDDLLVAGAAYRSRAEPDFSAAERDRLAAVAGHVARALQLADRLGLHEQAGAFSLSVLDAITIGVILIDARFRLVLANAAAERVLSDGRWLTTAGGRLRAIRASEAMAFDHLMHDAVENREGRGRAGGGICRLLSRDGGVLPVFAAPVRLPLTGNRLAPAAAAIVFSDPDSPPRENAEALAAAFGLTPREGALLEALVAGLSLAEYAERAGVSINTVRTQLASIFGKTGHMRQSTLVAMVASHPVARIACAGNEADA